jgi:hypothetical protein
MAALNREVTGIGFVEGHLERQPNVCVCQPRGGGPAPRVSESCGIETKIEEADL